MTLEEAKTLKIGDKLIVIDDYDSANLLKNGYIVTFMRYKEYGMDRLRIHVEELSTHGDWYAKRFKLYELVEDTEILL